MGDQRYRSDIRHGRVPLRIRRVDENRYRVTDADGRGLQYRKRADFSADALRALDAGGGREVVLEGWLNRFGRWSISGPRVETVAQPGQNWKPRTGEDR